MKARFFSRRAGSRAAVPSSVTIRRGAGVGGSDRITLTWPDGAIKNSWLQVVVCAGVHTGLAEPDVFSFGNLVGDTGEGDSNFRVNALDLAAAKRALNTDSDITGRYDFNRDGRVNAIDVAAVRSNLNRSLTNPLLPPPASALGAGTRPRLWDEFAAPSGV